MGGKESRVMIGDWDGHVARPFRGVPFIGHLVNEATTRQEVNAYLCCNKARQRLKAQWLREGCKLRYAVRATRGISAGEAVLMDYGPL